MLRCNCSILADTDAGEAIVVDPGDDVSRILALLQKHKLKLTQIVVTHAHIDHVGGAVALRRATGAPIYLNQRDLPLLEHMAEQPKWIGISMPIPEVAPPDVDAGQGTIVAAGKWRGEILETPGHTPGSVCLYFAPEGLLLAGDTLFAGGIGRTDFPGGDTAQMMRSLEGTIMALPEQTLVVPGHGPETTVGEERETNPFLIAR
jgi:glyoxylase-like metal-dependent hydrolase (beta-lactamase superfamily II)